MHTRNSVKQDDVLTLIQTVPGITKAQIMSTLKLQKRAAEMHLARLRAAGRAHSRIVPNQMHRTWHPGEGPEYKPQRFASIFDYADRFCLEAA